MTGAPATKTPTRKPLRLWPGIALASLEVFLKFVLPLFAPEALLVSLFGSLICTLAIILWWLLFSRAPWVDRLGAVAIMAAALVTTRLLLDKSIATGAMGMLFPVLVAPGLSVAFVVWAWASRGLSGGARRATMAATIVIACGVWALTRTGGFTGDFRNDLHWRWTKTAEEKLVAVSPSIPAALPPAPATVPPAAPPAAVSPQVPDKPILAKPSNEPLKIPPPAAEPETGVVWPGFRGPHRDGIVTGTRINTDWKAAPPKLLWRRPVGPGWSSFAVRRGLIYTQEQRGPEEVVSCYKLDTGEPVWAHRDPARFWESNGGPGPRGTPTLSQGRAYTFGATGILNVLDAGTGAVIWSHNAAADTGRKIPQWGFSSSPLVLDDEVIVATAGQLIAYDRASGARRWLGPVRGVGYSSPHLATIGGVTQVLLLNADGLTSVSPSDGAVLWEHQWKGYPIVQPALTEEGDVLIGVSDSSGTRRLAAEHGTGGWTVTERWTSKGLKPYFNDLVVHNGHAYGFDGGILACIDLKDGSRKWKGGRYGHGQLILLADQDLLLVLTEEGELALVRATPDPFTELARSPAIEGKTWNHPALAGDVLLVRNGEEMAAFRLALAGS